MKIGLMNNPQNNLLDEIEWISSNRFDFIDLTIEPPGAYDIDVREIKKLLNDVGLEVIGHTNPYLPAIIPIESIKKACIDEFRKYIDIFTRLGATLMNVHPFYLRSSFSQEEMLQANIQLLKTLNKLCKKKGITLMLENYKAPFDSSEIFLQITTEVPGLKVHLDVGHANLAGPETAKKFFETFGNDIAHMHFSDNRGINDDHIPLGCGNIDWKEIIKLIKLIKYNKTITLEIFSPDREYQLISREKLKKWLKNLNN